MRMNLSKNVRRAGCLLAAVLTVGAAGCKSNDRAERQGIPDDAKIEQVKALEPNADVHIAAGDLAVGQGKLDEAIKQFEKALELEPNSKPALFKLATLYTYDKQFDTAIATWQKYCDATNQSANGYVNLGRANELAERWKPAEVAYLRAVNREPNNKAAHVNYGILLAKRDRFDEAQTQFALALTPAEVQYNLASVYELKHNYAAATAGYEKALSLDPRFVAAKQRLESLKSVTRAE